jgi:hypothetical protein
MDDSFEGGAWADGSPGDPELDALLRAGVAEFLLAGDTRAVPAELRPLGETLAALRAAPSVTEFHGEEAAMAFFRSLHGASRRGASRRGTAAYGHTLPLEVPAGMAAGRPRRARHAAPGRTRSTRRPSARKPRGRLGLTSVAAAALVVIVGIFAYSGNLPGPFQNAVHIIGAPVRHHETGHPSPSEAAGRLNGGATLAPTPTASQAGTGAAGPQEWCREYFTNPWRPGSKNWDRQDFQKLAKAANGPRWVLKFCIKYLTAPGWSPGHGYRFPPGWEGGSWAWIPDGQGYGGRPGSNGQGGVSVTSTRPGSAVAASPDAKVPSKH